MFLLGLFSGILLSSLFTYLGWILCEKKQRVKAVRIPEFMKRK